MVVKGYRIEPGANLQDANLQGANLWGVDLQGAHLQGANLWGVDLQGANLRGANLQDANLRGANLQDANLRDANLQGVDLRGANLQDANLRDANLQGVDLRGALVLEAGTTYDQYAVGVPKLLTAGGRTVAEVAEAWACHSWGNCPISVAFGVQSIKDVPAQYRDAAAVFVRLFDRGLVAKPVVVA